MGFDDVNIISLGPLAKVRPLKQIHASLKFGACDFRGKYDFFIFSGNWAHYASRKHRPNLFYCHTPVRAFYDQRDQMIRSRRSLLEKAGLYLWSSIHSHFDRRSVRHIDYIATNSENTARRIKKYYGREAKVVYPPCDTAKFADKGDGGFWLSVNRLYPEKRLEVQLEAFSRMPVEKLVIVGNSGSGDHSVEYARKLRTMLPPNVTIESDLPEDKLIDLYGRCRGLIVTAADEDFGMNAVEAMASGKPVIAPKEGGYLESVIDSKTGALIDCTPDDIIKAVGQVSLDFDKFKGPCMERAKKFDISVFLDGVKTIVDG
jgi:glycosyltransferase involved in cell wall biosynthesis